MNHAIGIYLAPEICQILGCCRKTLYNLMNSGQLGYNIDSTCRRYCTREQIDSYRRRKYPQADKLNWREIEFEIRAKR